MLVPLVFYFIFDIILSEIVKGWFYPSDQSTYMMISIVFHLLILNILFCDNDFNILIITYPIAIMTNFIKFIFREQISIYVYKIFQKLHLKIDKIDAHMNNETEQEGTYAIFLNKNLQMLVEIALRIALGIITVLFISIKLVLMNLVFYSNETDFTYTYVFLIISLGQVLFDIISCYLVINANSKTNKFCDIISIYCECKSIFSRRNSSWGTNSTDNLKAKEYRQYNSKYEILLRLGFSSQLFIILYLFSLGFFLMYLGLNYILNNSIFPWLDPIMIVIVFFFLAGALGIFILLQVVTEKKELWPSEELEKNKKLVVSQLKEKREEANKKKTQMGIQMCISELFLQLRPRVLETMMDKTLSREEQLMKCLMS